MSFALPSFMEKTAEGLMVLAVPLRQQLAVQPDCFIHAVDELLAQGQRFYGLDYAVFSQLVIYPESVWRRGGVSRLAADVVSFPQYRQELYKGVRFSEDSMQVEYIFQPVVVDTPYQHPLYGEKQPDGSVPVVGYEQRIRQEQAVLDLDEFIAAMWLKGVRCGLLLDVVTPALFSKKMSRMVVAQGQPAQPGRAAEVLNMLTPARQITEPLWRQGQWDMRCLENKFPSVERGQAIIKKIAARAGVRGFTVRAEPLEPPEPQDVDISVLVGEGTALEDSDDTVVLVAQTGGFIGVEHESKKLFITRTIETQVDINVKNTGDMALGADEFISHGEVQEGRTVQGKNMRFTAPVYGHLRSEQGFIVLDDVLSGGSAVVSGSGRIDISQRAIHARAVATKGHINVRYAENCVLVGEVVHVQHAVHCTVIGHRVQIQNAQACLVIADGMHVNECAEHKNESCRMWVVRPVMDAVLAQLDVANRALKQTQSTVAAKLADLTRIKNNPEFTRYIRLREVMHADPYSQSAATREEFNGLHQTQSLHLKTIERLLKELQKARALVPEQTALLASIQTQLDEVLQKHFCKIDVVHGETRVFAMPDALDLALYADRSAKDVALWLGNSTVAAQSEQLFHGQVGAFAWHLTPV